MAAASDSSAAGPWDPVEQTRAGSGMRIPLKASCAAHCLPAHRGEEVEASVIDGPRSVIWREAYHRRTTIQSILYHLVRGDLKGYTH